MDTTLNSKKITRKEDYKSLQWCADKVFLNFKIEENYTIVDSKLFFNKKVLSTKKTTFILLNGKNLITLKAQIKINYQKYKQIDLKNFFADEETIKIPIIGLCKKVIIKTKVKIYPKKNYSLDGLYESNQMICSQCEPQGFRKISWFPDRPDNLSIFKVRIEASKKYKFILSNGDLIRQCKIKGTDKKYVIWKDPFPKPSYLFALVAGNLEVTSGEFVTKSKKRVILEIYTDLGKKKYTKFALKSLKRAMRWDEQNYDLEYDLKRYMIVAVDHFNMGAMENKGLNLFNSKYVLCDKTISTDNDSKNIENIIAHEYFHNWTGNRVTCRDWFQLTLKEGLTVLRDQQFSSDMLKSFAIKRIEDVSFLRKHQFAEDSSANKHPIRPKEYIEINNFYTSTIYEKGAEVLRMMCNYLGEKKFKNAVKFYLETFDGKAATCEDFLESLEEFSKLNLKLFMLWYDQSGIINLKITRGLSKDKELVLIFSQSCKFFSNPLPIPIKFSLFDKQGKPIKFKYENSNYKKEHLFLFKTKTKKLLIPKINDQLIPSLMRGFSAPVKLKTDLTVEELLHLLEYDDDDFNKWDASRCLHTFYFNNKGVNKFTNVINNFIQNDKVNKKLLSLIIKPPSLDDFEQSFNNIDPLIIYKKRKNYIKSFFKNIEINLENSLLKIFHKYKNTSLSDNDKFFLSNTLSYLFFVKNKSAYDISKNLLKSNNMEEKKIGLNSFVDNNHLLALHYLKSFYNKYFNNDLVLEKWFQMMASININDKGLEIVKSLLIHPKFDFKSPNKIRSVLGSFQKNNVELFHANDETGYNFFIKNVLKIDKINPQVSARLIKPFTMFDNYKLNRKNKIKKYLRNIVKNNPSKDLFEVVHKAI